MPARGPGQGVRSLRLAVRGLLLSLDWGAGRGAPPQRSPRPHDGGHNPAAGSGPRGSLPTRPRETGRWATTWEPQRSLGSRILGSRTSFVLEGRSRRRFLGSRPVRGANQTPWPQKCRWVSRCSPSEAWFLRTARCPFDMAGGREPRSDRVRSFSKRWVMPF